VQITDLSPTLANTSVTDKNHSVTGRMLCIACAPDGSVLFAGSYSNLWKSSDGGQSWTQLTWPQPPTDQYDAPGSLGGWCAVDIAIALGWRVEKHPRLLATLTNSGHTDIVGFGDAGVWTSLGNGSGNFAAPNVVMADFGYQAGNWQVDLHPRFLATLTNSGFPDIVGFGDAGVWTALGLGNGAFQSARFVYSGFGVQQGWQVALHPRFMVDLTGNGHADIVGFGDAGVEVALGSGDGSFQPMEPVYPAFGVQQGWKVASHLRLLAVTTGSGHPDIVGFGDTGVSVALGKGDGTFQPAKPLFPQFGVDQGWQVALHPRLLVDLTGNGHADIVGFGDGGVSVALANGDGTFAAPLPLYAGFGVQQGWQVDLHPRFLAVTTSSGLPDIVGFGDAGVTVALGNGDGTFKPPQLVLPGFAVQQGWQVDRHPRFVTSLTKGGLAGIVGFGDDGVWSATADGNGGFSAAGYQLANFGYGTIVLALMSQNLTTGLNHSGSRGIWRSTDSGATWIQVLPLENVGQLEWALGSDHLVYAAAGSSLVVSKDAGMTFAEINPWGKSVAKSVNHVAVWQNAPADPDPAVIYALGASSMYVSFDGGASWTEDMATLPAHIGGPTSSNANFSTAKVMVISPTNPRQVYIVQDGSGQGKPATIYLFDYSQFPMVSQTSASPQSLLLPSYLTDISPDTTRQDAGNVFLAVTQAGRGDLLFLGGQRAIAYVGPLNSTSASDWQALDSNVHWDLHGILLSRDFAASLQGGNYKASAGTVWLLCDGGIRRSTDGGKTFLPTAGPNTLSALSVGGVAISGSGPALSLNTGDNDGFYSMSGGLNWSYQQYGGGDNDCAFADPLRPNSIFMATPRWNGLGQSVPASDGQTVTIYEAAPFHLPDASIDIATFRSIVLGPLFIPDPTNPGNTVPGWNASSDFYSRGSRPIVLGLPGETPPAQGDYIFILNPLLQPVLVRSQSILNISSNQEWKTTATEPTPGSNAYLQGPPLPPPIPPSQSQIPNPSLGIVQASGGHAATVFYVGGDGTLRSWTAGQAEWQLLVPANPADDYAVSVNLAIRFFVSPYQPNLIYLLDEDHVKRSDDGGLSWRVDSSLEMELTWNSQIAISSDDDSSGILDHNDLLLTDMKFDPNNPLVRFAVGQGGAFYTVDGAKWTRLLHSGALPCRPSSCYYDWITNPADPALYVSCAGRGLLKIDQFLTPGQPATVAPTALAFPSQQIGTTSLQQTVTVITGSQVLSGLSLVSNPPGGNVDFASVPPPGAALNPQNGQLLITVWFRPTAGGLRNANLEIAYSGADSPLIVELSGTGNAAPLPLLSVSPTSLFFNPKQITNHVVTLTSTGTAPVTISSIALADSNFSMSNTCPSAVTLQPGQKCTITVICRFIGPGGTSSMLITHDAPGSPTTVELTATSKSGTNP
jgi:hypothetical protein